MVTTRVIRVDDDVYRGLQNQARPFEDTPNSVLRRLLELGDDAEQVDEPTGSTPRPAKRRAGGSRNPQEAFRRPILDAVEELGGKARVTDVLKRVEQKMKSRLTQLDYSKVKSGLPRWQVYARWLRLRLVHQGLLRGERGYWEITDKGRAFLKESA
jgi:negative regulator of replication initiation